jgi:hypothetical protein
MPALREDCVSGIEEQKTTCPICGAEVKLGDLAAHVSTHQTPPKLPPKPKVVK